MRLSFLGTGASGGTPGLGRSARRESSILLDAPTRVLVDVTRHFRQQCANLPRLDAVVLTHAHRDAAGGIPALRRWCTVREHPQIAVFASPQTIAVLRSRHRRLDGLDLIAVEPHEPERIDGLDVVAAEVPHAREARFRTYAWRFRAGASSVVYASDVARLEPALRRFSEGAEMLVIDGAMWRRSLFAHLRTDRAVPELCRWSVGRILLTQIGRTAPRHEVLEREVEALCPRAAPAWDGLVVEV
jgi:phosphoribosyl 1,2-cyclic phosphodiesterase